MRISSRHKQSVVVICPDSLIRLGLEAVLKRCPESPWVDLFDTFDAFDASTEEPYDVAVVEGSILALHYDYFLGKRTKVVPLLTSRGMDEIPFGERELSYIDSYWELPKIEVALLNSLREQRKVLEDSKENGLSQREEEVLKEVAKGLSNKEIAERLSISLNTVMSHRKNITSKLNIKTVSGLTFYALMNGLITGEEVETL